MSARLAPAAIAAATTPADYAAARALFERYAAELGVDLCFQGFAQELEALPAMYGPPRGALLLARRDGEAIGCVGVRAFGDADCEMKRLYLAPNARGAGLGRALAESAIALARRLGHRRMLLDTLAQMREARALYAALGFRAVPPYYENPIAGAAYLALDLRVQA